MPNLEERGKDDEHSEGTKWKVFKKEFHKKGRRKPWNRCSSRDWPERSASNPI
jgi:hypothetical protein